MSLVLVHVYVPNVSRRRVRVKLDGDDEGPPGSMSKDSMGSMESRRALEVLTKDEGIETIESINVAEMCREFLETSKAILEFMGEIPYLIGPTKWTMFMFTCKATFAEECLRRLGNLGIGHKDGIGVVNIAPLHLQRISASLFPKAPVIATPAPVNAATAAAPSTQNESQNTLASIPNFKSQSSVDGGAQLSVPAQSPTASSESSSGFSVPADGEVVAETSLSSHHVHFDVDQDDEKGESLDSAHEIIEDLDVEVEIEKEKSQVETFMQSIKSRIAVDSVVELVSSSAQFSFDYFMLVLVASILACIGLVTNNTVVIVASMLVSPLMGPILAVTFGWTIVDMDMIKMGLFSELIGLLICCFVGFVGGLCSAPFVGEEWPNSEMAGRATWNSVIVGICIAIPSGVGVALSILGNNTSSLVGVAISASLLPPAVNTGILLAVGALYNTEYIITDWPLSQILEGAGWSFLLTVANIICIWIAGYLMFKLKEVAPLEGKSDFWVTHVPNARMYNTRVFRKNDPEALQIKEAIKHKLAQEGQTPELAAPMAHLNENTLQAINAKMQRPSTRHIFDESFFSPPPEEENQETVKSNSSLKTILKKGRRRVKQLQMSNK